MAMAKHKRDMSAFSIRDAPPALRFSPTSLRMRPRSPSKSPCRHSRSPTRSRITDDIFEDLSPARILERFTSASGELAKSIEASSPDQKQFGIRAAVASKKIEEWANEVGGWPWPSIGADGFVMPDKTYGIFGELKEDDMGLEEKVDTEEYWGSLPAPLVELYSSRVAEIFDDMFDLDIEEIKNKVLHLVATDAQPSATAGEDSLPTTPVKSKYTRLDTFTGMITHTVLDALPKLHRLRLLLDVWSVRIDILRDIPATLESLRDADTMLQSAWASLRATNSSGEEMMLTRFDYETMQIALGETITDTGKMIDSMLDRLDGRVDTVPGPWLDQMDAVETDYGNWTIAAGRKVQEGEWAVKAAKKAELERSLQMLQELAEQQAMADVADGDEVAIEDPNDEWEKVQIEDVAMSDHWSIPDTTAENIPLPDDEDQELLIERLALSDNGSEFGNSLAVEPPATNEAPQSDVPSTPQASTESRESQNDRAFNIPWGLDGQDDRSPTAGRDTYERGDQAGSSPPPSTRDTAAGSRTPSRASLDPSFRLGRSRTPSVKGRNTPPRLPLPYRIHTDGSHPGSPEILPSRPPSPSPTGSVNLRPFILGTSAIASSQPPSPIIPRGRSSRNSVAPAGWDIGDSQNAGSANPVSRRDSQASPTSPIFPSFRGSPLFPGSRSSSISLRPSRCKRRSQTVFGDDEELALLAAASNRAAQMSSTPPARGGNTANERKSSPTSHMSTSDPFTDIPRLMATPTTQAAAPLTPPPMSASNTMHAIMSPSNQPGPTRQFSDDECPPSPSKKIVLDDGGTPRSPKKRKKPIKERRPSLLSMSDDDEENPRNPANRPALQPGWPGLQEGAPKFELKSPWARRKNSEPSSSTKRDSTANLSGDKDPQKRPGTPSTPLDKASELFGESDVANTSEPPPTAKVVIDDVFVSQRLDYGEFSAVPHTPTELQHARSNTSPNTHGSGASSSFKAIITPVEETSNDWPRFSDSENPIKVSPPTSASNDKKIPPTVSRDTLMDYQVDGGRSYDLDSSRHGSVVSFGSTDTVFKAHSRADSAGKLPVLNNIVALESPRIVEDLASDDDYDVNFSPSTRRSILYSNNDVRQSIEEDYSEPSTPIFSVPPTLDFYPTEDTEVDASAAELLVSADELALEAPNLTNVDVDLQYSQASPAKISDDQLQQQISEILGSIPARIELSNAPIPPQKSPMKPKHTIRKRPSRPSLSPAPRPSYSRAPTPSFTLAPAKSRLSRPRQQNNSDIQLYHLMRSTGDPPIKLFVRLVGERGERVMVRVGGGWADLGEYLKEYSSHHGRRAERSGEIQVELPTNSGRPRMGSIGSLNPAPGMLRTGPNGNVWSSPGSRPGSSMGSRPGSSLQVRKRGARVSDVADSRENSVRSPSMPLPFTSTTLRANAAKGQTPPARSVSRQAWSVGPDGEEVHLGPSGPKNKKGEMDEGRKIWVDGVVEKVRQVSVESSKDGFGALGQVGGTKRVFRKG
ncbi:hypothetical protein V500_07400 [Pseudogymnoascus sp. VKM F-4518 (FW-2643)]|nr:hypothetical protein V500_07400 [Pseudogymnoascus sp. VKM F-4518 (FW-2643)]